MGNALSNIEEKTLESKESESKEPEATPDLLEKLRVWLSMGKEPIDLTISELADQLNVKVEEFNGRLEKCSPPKKLDSPDKDLSQLLKDLFDTKSFEARHEEQIQNLQSLITDAKSFQSHLEDQISRLRVSVWSPETGFSADFLAWWEKGDFPSESVMFQKKGEISPEKEDSPSEYEEIYHLLKSWDYLRMALQNLEEASEHQKKQATTGVKILTELQKLMENPEGHEAVEEALKKSLKEDAKEVASEHLKSD